MRGTNHAIGFRSATPTTTWRLCKAEKERVLYRVCCKVSKDIRGNSRCTTSIMAEIIGLIASIVTVSEVIGGAIKVARTFTHATKELEALQVGSLCY